MRSARSMRALHRARGLIVGLATASALLPGTAASTTGTIDRYFELHGEGWFWYESEPKPSPEEPPKPPTASPTDKKAPPPTAVEPPPLSAEWLRINLPKYLDRALDEPTPDHVASYYYLQRVALDKSNKFSDVAQEVVTEDYALDEVSRRPLATYAVNEMNRVAGEKRGEVLREIGAKAGILFVYHSECQYCQVQAPVLKAFARTYGFTILPIALDGLPMADGSFPDYRPDTGQARELGVQQTPAMFLAQPPNRVVQLAQGALSIDELTQRVVMAAKQLGLIDEKSYDSTRPVQTTPLATDLRPPPEAASDSQKLIDYIRNSVRIRR